MIVSLCHKEELLIVSSESGDHYVCSKCLKPTEAHVSLSLLDNKECENANVF
jgi:hypothetical protein